MKNYRDFLIFTNNPLVPRCMGETFKIQFYEDATYRDILIKVRDLVYIGHTLYTHPLSGSVKPQETPYKSIVVSKVPHEFSQDGAEIMSNSITTYDKFVPRKRELSQNVLEDFQLIDYTLLSGAVDFDAVAGLSNSNN